MFFKNKKVISPPSNHRQHELRQWTRRARSSKVISAWMSRLDVAVMGIPEMGMILDVILQGGAHPSDVC